MDDSIKDINDVLDCLANVEYRGATVDEPEGSRYVLLSETLIQQIVRALKPLSHGRIPHENDPRVTTARQNEVRKHVDVPADDKQAVTLNKSEKKG